MPTFDELFEQLDPDENVRGKQFERICKWYLQHDPVYKGQLTRVWLWRDWPGRWYPKKEAGIDLVAEYRDGTLWAIQAKAYDPAYWVKKKDVDAFLSESNRKDKKTGHSLFSYRLLIATTDKLGPTAANTIEAQAIPVGHLDRRHLDTVEIDWPASPSDLRARRLPPKEPNGNWAYQGEAMNKVVKGFQQADRGKLIMACGTGKTLTTLFIREKLAAERTLVLMPSLQLMKQTIGEWRRNKKVDFDFLPVCSDETVSKDDDDMPVSNTSDLGFPPTTDPKKIATFLRQRSGPRVLFATYQSSPAIAKAFKLGHVPAFDLAIADEAHRCAAAHSSEFATILDNEKIKAHRRLFVTATPRIYSARVLRTAKEAGFEFASMDDEAKFGEVFHRLTFREAIERDLLTDYQVAIIGVDNATYRDWAEKGWFITIGGNEVTDARAVAGQIGLAKAMRPKAVGGYDLRRVITFHRLRKRAKEFAASLPEVIDWMPARQQPDGKLWTAYVDGTMPADDRHRRLQSLSEVGEGERAVISNARCLTEGIDVPTLDGVAFIDPKRSEIDIAQAVGRAIRLADGKTTGTIVIPVFIDTDEPNPDVILDDSAFKPVWDVLLALRSHDEELAQQLDDLRRMLGRLPRGSRGPLPLPPNIHVDIPDVPGAEFARAFNVRLVKMTTASFEEYVGAYEQYYAEHGDGLVQNGYQTDYGLPLGQWVANQRSRKRMTEAPPDKAWLRDCYQLTPEREQRLNDLPGWEWDVLDAQWENIYQQILKEGTTAFPANSPVGQWTRIQRWNYANGNLSSERQAKLLALPGGWEWTANAHDVKWEKIYQQILKDGITTSRQRGWAADQRERYAQGDLSPERQAKLLALPGGWEWKVLDAQWEEIYQQVLKEGSTAYLQVGTSSGRTQYGRWVSRQREEYAKGNLSRERQEKLLALPGWKWNAKVQKITASDRQKIRQAYAEGKTQTELARQYGVAPSHISKICTSPKYAGR